MDTNKKKSKLSKDQGTISTHNMTEAGIVKFVKAAIRYLEAGLTKGLKPSDTDLFNIRDEMIGELHQLLYLYSLK